MASKNMHRSSWHTSHAEVNEWAKKTPSTKPEKNVTPVTDGEINSTEFWKKNEHAAYRIE